MASEETGEKVDVYLYPCDITSGTFFSFIGDFVSMPTGYSNVIVHVKKGKFSEVEPVLREALTKPPNKLISKLYHVDFFLDRDGELFAIDGSMEIEGEEKIRFSVSKKKSEVLRYFRRL